MFHKYEANSYLLVYLLILTDLIGGFNSWWGYLILLFTKIPPLVKRFLTELVPNKYSLQRPRRHFDFSTSSSRLRIRDTRHRKLLLTQSNQEVHLRSFYYSIADSHQIRQSFASFRNLSYFPNCENFPLF